MYSQSILHQHFDEEAPGLPAQTQERSLLKCHVVVSDIHECCPVILPNKWRDARQAAGAEWAKVRGRQGLEVKYNACGGGGGAGTSGDPRFRDTRGWANLDRKPEFSQSCPSPTRGPWLGREAAVPWELTACALGNKFCSSSSVAFPEKMYSPSLCSVF